MALEVEQKLVRVFESDRDGTQAEVTWECALADAEAVVANKRTTTFSGYGLLSSLRCQEISSVEHQPRRNVATVKALYSNKWRGGGRRALTENLGRGVVTVVPIMTSRVPQKDGYPLGTAFIDGDDSFKWEALDSREAFLIESELALVVMRLAVALSTGYVSAVKGLVGTVNNTACSGFLGAPAKTLLMLSPRIEITAGDSYGFLEVNMLYLKSGWDSVDLQKFQRIAAPLPLGDGTKTAFKMWGWKATGDVAPISFPTASWSSVNGWAYWVMK